MNAPIIREGRTERAPLRFLAADGSPVEWSATFGPDGEIDDPLLTRRPVVAADRLSLVQYRLPSTAVELPGRREWLEREVGAALTLLRAVGTGPYRPLFRTVVGYEMDADEPFVLYEPTRGRLLAELSDAPLSLTDWNGVVRSLLLAVRALAGAGLVHADIRPETVWWDGDAVQLGRLQRAVPVGRPRVIGGAMPYAPPEQRAGAGPADHRDDLWSVGQMAYSLLTGHPSRYDGPPPDLAARPVLARPLGGVFAPRAQDRPDVETALAAVGLRQSAALSAADPLEPGRRAFAEQLAAKRGGGPAAAPDADPPEPGSVRGRRRWRRYEREGTR